ncbi:amino acid ABC transporter permease [Streptomyces apocyni]|uniref:amino acid ABC transporter permease n=1 Tax=Streptomyces apocyni TaxID=2654677 RepID=UPI0012EA8B5D|nr:amino acid ABC transporter permease [Streptomyces apocyni]
MAWDEWERLKADAAGQKSARGTGQLRHSDKPWTDATTVARELRSSMATGRTDLSQAHGDVAAGTTGLASAAALKTVLTSWERRLESVRDECGALAPKLRQAAKEQRGTDAGVKSDVDSVRVPDGGLRR